MCSGFCVWARKWTDCQKYSFESSGWSVLKVHVLPLICHDLHHDKIYNLGTWLLVLGICFRKLLLFYKIHFYHRIQMLYLPAFNDTLNASKECNGFLFYLLP